MHPLPTLPCFSWLLLLVVACGLARAASPLPRSTPEKQGVAPAALLEFVDTLDKRIDGLHSLMVVRHGHVIAEGWWTPYEAGHNHVLYSLSKSFTATAVGFAVAEGAVSLDDPVLKFFPGDAPTNAGSHLKAMRVRDLLMMSTGHQDEPPVAPDVLSAQTFFTQAVVHLPGTHFKYNTPATFMQSAIVQKVSGRTVLDYLRPRLFEPLGIEHPVWDTNFQGISLGGYGLRVRTEDIAKFGQLYLQQGRWNGKALLPPDWVAMASARQTSNGSNPESDWNQGYGFQFWRCRHNAFRGDGAFGQFCLVMPEQDAVVAITSGVKDMQAVLNVIWDKLLPALRARSVKSDAAGRRQLADRLAHLELRTAQGAVDSPRAGAVLNRTYRFPDNDQKIEHLAITSRQPGVVGLIARINGKDLNIPCGHREWRTGRAFLFGGRLAQFPDEPVAGSFAWPAEDTCVIQYCAVETPYHVKLTLKFEGDQVTLDNESNVAFGPTKRPQLIGRAQ